MDQPSLFHEEVDTLTSLSENLSNSVIVPIPSQPTNVPKIDPSQPSEDVTIAGLKVPKYAHGFFGIAFGVTYENFVVRLAELNPKTLTRPAAEEAWWTLVQQAYREWNPHPALYDEQKKRDLRKRATAQIHGKGLKGFDVELFWGKREAGFNRTEVIARKKRKSDEKINMNRLEYADRKEKKRNWRAVKHVEDTSNITLQMRPKPAESEEAAEYLYPEKKFEQEDEDMKL